MNFKGIIKLTKTQYDTLMSTGQCVDSQGVTHTYQDGYQYVTDDIDYVDLTSAQGIGGEKTFTDGDNTHDDVVIDYTGVKAENAAGTSSVKMTKTGFTKDGTYSLALPAQNGTLVAGVYRHRLWITDDTQVQPLTFLCTFYTTTSSQINTFAQLSAVADIINDCIGVLEFGSTLETVYLGIGSTTVDFYTSPRGVSPQYYITSANLSLSDTVTQL